MEIAGYLCAMLVGISLGLLGSGGSILTVPIMVYLFVVDPIDATGYSLFVVGLTSATGAYIYVRRKVANLRVAAIFALPSLLTVVAVRKFLLPVFPSSVRFGETDVRSELLIMIIFSLLMILAAVKMISPVTENENQEVNKKYDFFTLILTGIASGILTGIFGIGGGFIIIPALVIFARIPLKMSVGTSLIIITLNSFAGFAQEIFNRPHEIDYPFLVKFSIMSVAGMFAGLMFSSRLPSVKLKKIFGWFVLVTGFSIFILEIRQLVV